jgi:polyketide cyclase/dehydrase/lipid transport protein
MAIDVTATTLIDAPRPRVARFVMDHRNDTAWIGGIRESQLQGDEPFGVGSLVRRVATFLGRRIEYVNRVEELEPDTRLLMRSVKSPFPMAVTYAFEDGVDGGTRTSVRVQGGTPGSFYRMAEPLLARQVRRSVTRDLRTLKALLEQPL